MRAVFLVFGWVSLPLGGRWIFCGLPQKRRMRGFLNTTPFLLEKKPGCA